MTDEKPTFTEYDVANDFVEAIDSEVVSNLGWSPLRDYNWPPIGEDEHDDGSWPFTVVRDGREFEVDIDVRVAELTPERKAAREARDAELLAHLERHSKLQADR